MELAQIFKELVADNHLHAKWLNTLSYMENAGAKKISASEHKEKVTLIVLKHAAEEHRHAYYLKKQISKIGESLCENYADEFLIAANYSKYYLQVLDIKVARYLKNSLKLSGFDLKFAAYLLVTYAIELRADELYPVYQQALDEQKSKVNVKSIILEEEGHLEEMMQQLKLFSHDWQSHADVAVNYEKELFNDWMQEIATELSTKKEPLNA